MLNWWGDVTVVGGMFPLIIADIPLGLKPVDAAYFRKSREARFGKPLEEIMAGRDKAVEGFRKSLEPLRLTLKTQAYLGGEKPNYADYIVFGPFQWARVVSPFKLLARTIRFMPGASGCSTRSTAWRGSRRGMRCREFVICDEINAASARRADAASPAPRRDHPPPPRIGRATLPSAAPCPAP